MPELAPPVIPWERWVGREQPVLRADGLVLRPWEPADTPSVVAAYEDPDIQRWHVRTMAPGEATGWVRSWAEQWSAGNGASWAVVEADVVVGRSGAQHVDLTAGGGHVAYWVVPGARGRGVAVRALTPSRSGLSTRWACTAGARARGGSAPSVRRWAVPATRQVLRRARSVDRTVAKVHQAAYGVRATAARWCSGAARRTRSHELTASAPACTADSHT